METLLLQNRSFILDQLDVQHVVADGSYLQTATANRKGCQIDYLIQTKTNSLLLCEFKFKRRTIGMEIIDEINQKINRLVIPRGIGVVPVLFHSGEVNDRVFESQFFYKTIDLENVIYDHISPPRW